MAGADVVAFDHHPAGGVVDRRRGSQFFHHCHRASDTEHGHLHEPVFARLLNARDRAAQRTAAAAPRC